MEPSARSDLSPPLGARPAALERLGTRPEFSVVIIGAGINGLGSFRDLCLQGVDCLLIDRDDFCAGTSSAPSRMIHGGLKYLETGEFGLVAESVRERNQLLRHAAHLVKPLEMIIPLRRWWGGEWASALRFLGRKARSHERGWLVTKAGLALYDHFSRRNRVAPRHQMLSGERLRALMPAITADACAAASFFDARIEMPERLGIELALDGLAAEPRSLALNHMALQGLADGRLQLQDRLSGARYEVAARLVLNAAGPWIDPTNARLQGTQGLIGGTKGSHLLLALPALHEQLGGRMVYFDPGDGRLCLVSTLAGQVLLGATDIPAADADAVRCEDDEVDYLLAALRTVFPGVPVSPADIVFSYCGVRPLPRTDGTRPGEISRDHSIHIDEANGQRPFAVLSLIGGKWTTFRAFSEQATDLCLQRLDRRRRCSTRDLPAPGGAGLGTDAAAWQGLLQQVQALSGGSREWATRWVQRYGQRACQLAQQVADSPHPDRALPALPDYSEQEIRFLIATEGVQSLDDLALRRLPLGLQGRVNRVSSEALAAIASDMLDWSDADIQEQLQHLADTLLHKHRIDLASGQFR